MKRIRTLHMLFKQTGSDKLIWGFFAFTVVCAFIIWLTEPAVENFGDAIWYCYAVVTTVGFGDVLVHTLLARIISIILSVYAVIIIAIITGVVVNFYNEIVNSRNKETMSVFLDKLETLPDMSKEELADVADRVRKFRKNGRKW